MPMLRFSGAMLTRFFTEVTGSEAMRISPASGLWRPAMHMRVVVLPQPEGPSRVRNFPSGMPKEMPSHGAVVAEILDEVGDFEIGVFGHCLMR